MVEQSGSSWRQAVGLRVDYDREASHYRAGREVPLEQIEPWRPVIGACIGPGDEPLLDIGAGTGLWTRAFRTWFDAEVVALEPSSGMRKVGSEIGLHSSSCYVAGSAEHLPFGRSVFRAAWLSTVVHHLTDLSVCAGELRRTLVDGTSVMIRNSFPGASKRWNSSGTSPPLPA
jgi:ubiquinone/menaquinone biosynthesis C-methylase UbiE